jgi:hypothetical protein
MRAVRWVGIAVVAAIVLLLAADRVGVHLAEHAAADSLKSSQHLKSAPQVDIAGFPFLNQLATGNYDKITVTADDVPVGQHLQLLISRLRVVLHGLSVSRDFHTFHADRASAGALISYAELGRTLGVTLDYAGNGRVRATRTVTVAGTSLRATVTARPRLVGDALSFAATSVDNAGALGTSVAGALSRLFQVAISLRAIPFGIRVRNVVVDAAGVTIALAGRKLSYVR